MTLAEPACAVGPCDQPRLPGTSFCGRHGPKAGSRAAKTLAPSPSDRIVCPHCQTRGLVRTKQVKAKRGVSGGKATGAVLTGGLSLLATGLSRKEKVTEATCGNCGVTWHL